VSPVVGRHRAAGLVQAAASMAAVPVAANHSHSLCSWTHRYRVWRYCSDPEINHQAGFAGDQGQRM